MSDRTPIIESERSLVTVMFADISGFTVISEKMDPEEVTDIMNECFCLMGECIERHGGTIDKFMGDCVMALFGASKTLEDAPQQALETALEIQTAIQIFNQNIKLVFSVEYPHRNQYRPGHRRDDGKRDKAGVHCHGGDREPGLKDG